MCFPSKSSEVAGSKQAGGDDPVILATTDRRSGQRSRTGGSRGTWPSGSGIPKENRRADQALTGGAAVRNWVARAGDRNGDRRAALLAQLGQDEKSRQNSEDCFHHSPLNHAARVSLTDAPR